MSERLDARDAALVREVLEEIESEAPPRNWGAAGSAAAVVGLVLLVGIPLVGRSVELPHVVGVTALAVGGALLVLGVVARTSAGGFARGRSVAAAEAALRQLEGGDEDRETRLRAATLLLAHAYAMYGPRAIVSFDIVDGRRRLGERLALVEAVEKELLRDGRIAPVFTDEGAERG